ncbi:hypothetical protein J7L49_02955 [Candidatus Bathyarchaeota archaeon]|nr:hypothetical protein [Candidatus Bathyarchaeota archaeon]
MENAEEVLKEETDKETEEETRFFHPVKLSKTEETLDENEIEKSKVKIETKLQDLLRSINEETLQLSEFLMEEPKLINELCTSLKQILKKLNISFNLSPSSLPVKRKVKKVILNQDGHLIFVYEKEEVDSAFLAEYPPEIVMAVLWTVMPELAKVLTLYRKKVSVRINFFGRVKKELNGVAKAMLGTEQQPVEKTEEHMDVVKSSLENEDKNI